MPYTHVVFDLDGTLLNTLEDLARAGNHVCAANGWPTFAHDAYRFKVGNGIPKLIERIVPAEYAYDSRVLQATYTAFCSYYDAHKEDHTCPYPGVLDMLDALSAQEIQLAVLSNKDHAAVAPLVEHYFGDRFCAVQGRTDAFPPKPAAPATLHVLAEMGADPAHTLYVGDSNVDVATGHNAGLTVAGVSWGFRGRSELEAAGADAIVDTPAELTQLIINGRVSSQRSSL